MGIMVVAHGRCGGNCGMNNTCKYVAAIDWRVLSPDTLELRDGT